MNNYIFINDKKSTEISGLIILTLPPISKPRKRTKKEEIDGVDGDIITELGYEAYDKEIKIGLAKHYDVDEVIEYFDAKGKIVFSNEPDKYYNFEIIDEIDFERLLRYKTATVKVHVQPFKYCNEQCDKIANITDEKEIIVNNGGNIYSKPIITIYGTGTINLSLNDEQMFVIDLGNEKQITIDIEKMEAYNQETKLLKNRLVTGNYDNFRLKKSKNIISWTGAITKIVVSKYSRWI